MQPLVLTPSPYPTESLLGYTLRISERNGYETPTHVLDYAGISRREALSPFFPLNRLAAVLGKEPKHFPPISYSTRTNTGALQFHILGHNLGQSFTKRIYRLAKPAFCPQCVTEKGFLEAHWDVEYVTACPRHACKLLSACPACGKHVMWHRKGLLTCECGEEWSGTRLDPADAATIELQSILIAKIQNEPLDDSLAVSMPIEHLTQLPLHVLLGVIRVIGQSAMKAAKSTSTDSYQIATQAARVLSQWPANYEHLINGIATWGKGTELKHFLAALGRIGLTEEVGSFLRTPIRSRMATVPSIKSNRVRTETKSKGRAASAGKHPTHARFNSLGERRAAAFLEIPVRTLRALRASGHYKVLNIPIPTNAYHVTDLENFRQEILEFAPSHPSSDNENRETLSLGYALQQIRFRAHNAKGSLISAIMNGQIAAVGRSSDRIPDIILRKSDVIAFRDQTRSQAEGNTLSVAEAATYLSCDPSALIAMVKDGSLQASRVPAGMRLSKSSVTQFGTKYTSVAKLAKELGTSSTKLQRELLGHNIPLQKWERSHRKSPQAFVSIEYAGRYREILEIRKTNT